MNILVSNRNKWLVTFSKATESGFSDSKMLGMSQATLTYKNIKIFISTFRFNAGNKTKLPQLIWETGDIGVSLSIASIKIWNFLKGLFSFIDKRNLQKLPKQLIHFNRFTRSRSSKETSVNAWTCFSYFDQRINVNFLLQNSSL